MTTLQIIHNLMGRSERHLFLRTPWEMVHDGLDLFPFFVTAAVRMTGQARACRTSEDIDAAWAAFHHGCCNGVYDRTKCDRLMIRLGAKYLRRQRRRPQLPKPSLS
jgi:hypothetical protein